MNLDLSPPNELDRRFHAPPAWQWGVVDRGSHKLRYGYALPQGEHKKPPIMVVALPGLSEFCEKYFELAHDFLAQGFGFAVLDWRGQGLSSRYLENPQKRHSQGFDQDAHDLKAVVDALPVSAEETRFTMIAHSMGGNIGLRVLDAYPDLFKAAAFFAPLVGLHVFENTPEFLAPPLTQALDKFAAQNYAPLGGDWEPFTRELQSHLLFSSDPPRAAVHGAWMKAHPSLRVGHITNKWLKDAHDSCLYVQKNMQIEKIKMPALFFVAKHEKFVDNKKTKQLSCKVPFADFIEFTQARHEIWMERDQIREDLLLRCYGMFRRACKSEK